MIRETIVTTQAPDGGVHIAPIGLIVEPEGFVIAPFRASQRPWRICASILTPSPITPMTC